MAVTAIEVAWLVEFPNYTPPADAAGAPTRFWSGEGDLDFAVDGTTRTWTGTLFGDRATVKAFPMQAVRQGAPARMRVEIEVGSDMAQLRTVILRDDPGPIEVRVHFIFRVAGTTAWNRLTRSRYGRISAGKFLNGIYEHEVESWSGDADRQTPKRWSHEQHIADHPGDGFFKFTSDLSQGTEIRWPQSG